MPGDSDKPMKELAWKELAARWLLAQGVSTVLLFMICGFIGYSVVYMIPLHLTTIQEGYEKIEESNETQLSRIMDSHDRQLQSITNSFRDTLDRIDSRVIRELERIRAENAQALDDRPFRRNDTTDQ